MLSFTASEKGEFGVKRPTISLILYNGDKFESVNVIEEELRFLPNFFQ